MPSLPTAGDAKVFTGPEFFRRSFEALSLGGDGALKVTLDLSRVSGRCPARPPAGQPCPKPGHRDL
jgi:hypothetical protein